MSEELQDVVDDGITLDGPEETTDNNADGIDTELATPSDDQHDNNGTDSPELTIQEKHQKEVNKQHKKYRDEERARKAVEKQLADSQKRLDELEKAQNVAPEVPPMPDHYDDNFESKVADRDAAIAQRAAWDAEQLGIQQRQQQLAHEQLLKQQQETADTVSKYVERAKELKISPDDLQAAGQMVGQYVSSDLAQHMLTDPDGPMIVAYLASNPMAMDDLINLPFGNAAVHIENVIKPKLIELKPKPSSAPPPVDTLRGNGVAPKQIGPEGATYE